MIARQTYNRIYRSGVTAGCSMGTGCDEVRKCYAAAQGHDERCPIAMMREDLRDEIWDALMNREDIGVSLQSLADAVLDRLEALGVLRDSDGTATAAQCEDIAVPKDCQARAESIAPELPETPERKVHDQQ